MNYYNEKKLIIEKKNEMSISNIFILYYIFI